MLITRHSEPFYILSDYKFKKGRHWLEGVGSVEFEGIDSGMQL